LKTSNEKQAKSVWWKILLFILGFLVLVVGVPLIINGCYKATPVFITKWNAADVLSYYGTLLGAVSTVSALVCTISFTRKQIQRDRFLEHSRIKWEKAEAVITQTLIDISPLKLLNSAKLDGSLTSNLHTIILNLQAYAISAKTSLNMIKCYIGPRDYEQIGPYVAELQSSIIQFCEIESSLMDEYMSLQTIALANGGVIPDSELLLHLDRTSEINKEIPLAHDGPYQRLLNMKREVFEKIYADIDAQADQILKFGRKR